MGKFQQLCKQMKNCIFLKILTFGIKEGTDAEVTFSQMILLNAKIWVYIATNGGNCGGYDFSGLFQITGVKFEISLNWLTFRLQ